MAPKKFYWLKMKDDFFKDRLIKKLRKVAGGDTYTIIYLKMLLLSLKNEGRILYEGVEETFAAEMALELDETPEDVELAIVFLLKNGLMEQQDEDHFFMTTIPESIGSETGKAAIMRRKRAKEKALEVTDGNNVTAELPSVTNCYTEIEIEKEIDIEIDKEKDKREKIDYQQIADLYNETCVSFPRVKSLSDARKKAIKARLHKYSIDDFRNLFEKAEASSFLKGSNNRNWSASFDWLIKDQNMVKVLEGNYDDRKHEKASPQQDYSFFNNRSPAEQLEGGVGFDDYF